MRKAGTRLILLLLVGSAGLALWPLVGAPFERAFQDSAELTLGSSTFGSGGYAHFDVPARDLRPGQAARHETWDAPVRLSVDRAAVEHVIMINPRRLAYLPILMLSTIVLCSPLPAAQKLLRTLLGAVTLWCLALGNVWIMVAWVFNQVPGLVYDLSPLQTSLLHFAYEGFVTPIAHKYVIALVLAVCLLRFRGPRMALHGRASAALPHGKAEQRRDEQPDVRDRERRHGRSR